MIKIVLVVKGPMTIVLPVPLAMEQLSEQIQQRWAAKEMIPVLPKIVSDVHLILTTSVRSVNQDTAIS